MINICYDLSINTSEKGETIMLDFRNGNISDCMQRYELYTCCRASESDTARSFPAYQTSEKTYGTELFIRDKKKLRLTPAGEILRSASGNHEK